MKTRTWMILSLAVCLSSARLSAEVVWSEDFEIKEKLTDKWTESYCKKSGRKFPRVPVEGIASLDASINVSGDNSLKVSPSESRGVIRGICLTAELPENKGGVLSAWFYDSGNSYGAYNIAVETFMNRGKASLYVLGLGSHYLFKCGTLKIATPFNRKKGWHKVQFVLGGNDGKASKLRCYLDGKLAGESDAEFKFFKNVRLGSGDYGIRNPVYFDAIELNNDPKSIEKDLFKGQEIFLSSNRIGNLFYDDEAVKIQVTLKNYGKTLKKVEILAELKDGKGENSIAKLAKTLDLPSNATTTLDFEFDIKKRKGLYLCEVILKNKQQLLAKNKIRLGVSIPANELKKDPRSPLGVHFHPMRDKIPDIGWKWQRIYTHQTSWGRIEKEPGKFNWEITDDMIEEALRNNRLVLFNLGFPPLWASGAPEATKKDKPVQAKNFPPKNMADWKRFIEAIVRRYKGKVKAWEIWNETNVPYFRGSKEDYLEVLKNAYQIIKKVDPEAIVVGISATGSGDAYVKELLEMGAAEYMDALSTHIYLVGTEKPEGEKSVGKINMSEDFKEVMLKKGKVVPVWDTESSYQMAGLTKNGLPMNSEEVLKMRKIGKLTKHCADDDIANWVVRKYIILYTKGVNRFFWHYGYPMVHADACVSGACPSLAAMARELTGAKFIREIELGDENLRGYLFKKDQGFMAALWSISGESQVELGLRDARIFDRFGNEINKKVENGKLTLPLTKEPLYLRTSSPEIKKVGSSINIATCDPVEKASFTVEIEIDNPGTESLNGVISLTVPENYKVSPTSEKITINSGQSQKTTFQIEVPKNLKKALCMIKAEFQSNDAKSKVSRQKNLKIKIPEDAPAKGNKNLAIDGDLSEWNGFGEKFVLNRDDQVFFGLPLDDPALMDMAVAAGKHFREGIGDLSGEFKVAWDEKYLYIALRVTDPVVINEIENQPYKGDCVEIFLDTRDPKGKQGARDRGKGVYHLFFVPPVNGQAAKSVFFKRFYSRNGKNYSKEPLIITSGDEAAHQKLAAKFADLRFASKRTKDGYTMEIRFPFSAMVGVKPELGQTIGFDLVLNDTDYKGEDRKAIMVWRGTERNYKNASLLWKLKLTGEVK